MIGDMKFEESSLTGYLVKNLESLTEADPLILAEYVAALLKKDKPIKELEQLCTENLVDFLGQDTKTFITKLFQALEDGCITTCGESSAKTEVVESSASVTNVELTVNNLSLKAEKVLSSSGHHSDLEEKEVSEDDDDDRNHKHRRRDTRSLSTDKDVQEQFVRKPNRKRDKPYENGHIFSASDPRSSDFRRNHSLAAGESVKYEKRLRGFGPAPRPPQDLSQWSSGLQGFTGSFFDLSRFPVGRGRGRNSFPWSHHDSRFGTIDTLDFASQTAVRGPTPGIFAASTQNTTWGPFGLIGMPSGSLDTVHPLGLQGTLRPPMNPPFNMGVPRQRCRDFEERGFCLSGELCPMEHGVNRIVVEDVQSLSLFNLPVSLTSTRMMGGQAGPGPLHSVSASSISTNNKALSSKSGKSVVGDDGLELKGLLSSSVAVETDLYDPDQPLWSNDEPEMSGPRLRLPSPKINEPDTQWETELAEHTQVSERVGKAFTASHSTKSSVWGRIKNAGNKLEIAGQLCSGYLENEMKGGQDAVISNSHNVASQEKRNCYDLGPSASNFNTIPQPRADVAQSNVGRSSQKASRTLFVYGIPLQNNRRDALYSHFRNFGEVVDIHIPHNSEKAFVQFAKREEAESALKAPDAVMGNRFIKLWWANRDSIPDENESSGNTLSTAPRGMSAGNITFKPSVDKRKENVPSTAPKAEGTAHTTSVPVSVSGHQTFVMSSGSKGPPPSQKKLESLEVLKEELRKKQEMLEQKRNEFRRQLDKFEKQAITVKGEVVCEQTVEKHKADTAASLKVVSTLASMKPNSGAMIRPDADRMQDKNCCSGESIVSPNGLKTSSTHQPLKCLKQPNRMPGPPFLPNRFKLDNRPTAFRVLPPLPPDLANVAVLREHFSAFGDLSQVEIEDPEGDQVNTSELMPSSKCSACIFFTSRRSAEKAFQGGRCWRDYKLQFTWLTLSSSSGNTDNGRAGENSSSASTTTKVTVDTDVKPLVCSLSSIQRCSSTCAGEEARTEEGKVQLEEVVGVNGGVSCLGTEPEETYPTGDLSK
ncbi:zinc finger CCCH domain-containing protein 27-like [Aristolochia californica]|uniref:zinc finger CCCH domain-containing protein 27-like n=1 Tax=Aristolochia californica TaxID=171875 RepID=UPI0035D81C52